MHALELPPPAPFPGDGDDEGDGGGCDYGNAPGGDDEKEGAGARCVPPCAGGAGAQFALECALLCLQLPRAVLQPADALLATFVGRSPGHGGGGGQNRSPGQGGGPSGRSGSGHGSGASVSGSSSDGGLGARGLGFGWGSGSLASDEELARHAAEAGQRIAAHYVEVRGDARAATIVFKVVTGPA